MDNFYQSCPPKMEDSRFLTDYRTSDVREYTAKQANNIERDDEYRLFSEKNGLNILNAQWNAISGEPNSCRPKMCLHQNNSIRSTNDAEYNTLVLHNAIKSGKIQPSHALYPKCKQMADYRIFDSNEVNFN